MISMPKPKVDPELEAQKQAADVSRIGAIKQSLGSDTSSMLRIFGGSGGLGSLLAPGALPMKGNSGFVSSAQDGSGFGLGGLYMNSGPLRPDGAGGGGMRGTGIGASTNSMGGGLF